MHKLVAVGLAAMLLMPVVVGAQGAISTLPDPGTLPDSPFYFLKSWGESIRLLFTFGAEKKAEQYLHLAEVRLAEYEKMIEKALRPAQGESAERTQAKYEQIAERTLEKYEDQLGRALAKVEELKAKSEEKAIEVKAKAEETTSKHLQVLQENLTKVPETAREGIKKALEASRKGIERVRWAPRNDETTAVEASQLIPEDEVVEGELVGYYTSITRTAFESTETCDVFTIIGGNPRLRGHFARLIEIGNTINSKNANGEIMLNLNFQTVNDTMKNTIIASTRSNPVMIEVKKPVVRPMGVGACYSPVEILGVKRSSTSSELNELRNLIDDRGLERELDSLLEGLE